jgi:hypothetical protein
LFDGRHFDRDTTLRDSIRHPAYYKIIGPRPFFT